MSSRKRSAAKGVKKEAPPNSPPNWPVFKPLLPPEDLSLETVVDSQILVVRNFWTAKLCKEYVSFLSTLPLTTTPGRPKKGEALRVNDRFQIVDPVFANRLWVETGLRELICNLENQDEESRAQLWGGTPISLNPSIRVYRYSRGQYFDCHYDESNNLVLERPNTPTSTRAKTTWTMLLYLTSSTTGCQGGETVFYPDDLPRGRNSVEEKVVVELETGKLLLHKHGNDCMLHEGCEVSEGEKWVIRSDLCVTR
ncbi:MAG: hypothetical protein M1818_004566 [Claussenomyces sp. TS43310]|nr:MAG: hypothetical protein M1818_004566 [Claussenomyces sp. TS43310]